MAEDSAPSGERLLRGPPANHAEVDPGATDSYLLALARANLGRLETLGHKLATEAVPEGMTSLALI